MKRFLIMLFICLSIPSFAQKEAVYEDIEWTDNWLLGAGKTDKPQILMIGNSITRGCYPTVRDAFEGRAYVSRLCNSKCLGDPGFWDDLKAVLKHHKYDIIQFNNGLHGFGYSEEVYEKNFPKFIKTIKKYQPQAKLIWATSTPTWTPDIKQYSSVIERIKKRNEIALKYINKYGIEVNDLWTTAINHPEYFVGNDGCHPNKEGWKALGSQVVSVMEKYL